MLTTAHLFGQDKEYRFDFGVLGGGGYYVGDATGHIFQNIQPAAGAFFRYKFNSRWSLQAKSQWQPIKFPAPEDDLAVKNNNLITRHLVATDVVGEFNFFRYGSSVYDGRVKRVSPYMFLGFGVGVYGVGQKMRIAPYIPLGFGLKWLFAPHCQLFLAWQHNIYFTDNLEQTEEYGNTYDLNGTNIIRNDLTSTFTLGFAVQFGLKKHKCHCNDD